MVFHDVDVFFYILAVVLELSRTTRKLEEQFKQPPAGQLVRQYR